MSLFRVFLERDKISLLNEGDLFKANPIMLPPLPFIKENKYGNYKKKVNVLYLHGFRDSSLSFSKFSVADIECDFYDHEHEMINVDTYYPDMDFGEEGGLVSDFFKTIFSSDYPEHIHELWNTSVDSIVDIADRESGYINNEIIENGFLIIVAHSLGTEVARVIVEKIRSDIKVIIIAMGGVANSCEYEELIDSQENILKVYNLYTNKDHALDGFLPQMNSKFFDPIGVCKVDSKKCENILMPFGAFGHSDYMNSPKSYLSINQLTCEIAMACLSLVDNGSAPIMQQSQLIYIK